LDRDFSPEEESSNFSSDSDRSEASHVCGNSYSSIIKRNMAFQTHCLGGEYKVELDIGKEDEDSSSAEDENEEEYEEVLQQSEKRARIEHGELPSGVVQEHMEIPMDWGYLWMIMMVISLVMMMIMEMRGMKSTHSLDQPAMILFLAVMWILMTLLATLKGEDGHILRMSSLISKISSYCFHNYTRK
jgi:hypothetical protein